MERRAVRTEVVGLALAACLHVSAAILALGVVLLPSLSPTMRFLIWGFNADAIFPEDYVSFTAAGAAFQLGLAAIMARAALRLRRGAPYLATSGLIVAVAAYVSVMLSFFGGGGILGVLAGSLGGIVGIRVNIKFAPPDYLSDILATRRRPHWRFAIVLMIGALILSLGVTIVQFAQGYGRALQGFLMLALPMGPFIAAWLSARWAEAEVNARGVLGHGPPSP